MPHSHTLSPGVQSGAAVPSLFNLAEPQFPNLENGGPMPSLTALLLGLEVIFAKHLAEYLAYDRYSPKIKHIFVAAERPWLAGSMVFYFCREQKASVCPQVCGPETQPLPYLKPSNCKPLWKAFSFNCSEQCF